MNKRKGPSQRPDHGKSKYRSPISSRSGRKSGSTDEVWLYGKYAVLSAIRNPARRIHRIITTRAFDESHGELLPPRLTQIVDGAEIGAQLGLDAVHQGIAAHVDPLPNRPLAEILDTAGSLERDILIILDQATDPRNVGAVMRSAAAFGCSGVILHKHHAPPETGSLAKSASGALETVPIVRVGNLARGMDEIKEAGYWCIGLDGGAEETLAEIGATGRVALVLGAEGSGMRRLTAENCDRLARIPISSDMESLNLSNAAAIALYELVRAN